MNETRGRHDMLFPTASGSVEADYLGFFAQRVPKDVGDQLYADGQPDIAMPAQTVDMKDLLRPLSTRAFPAEKLADITNLLGYIVICHEIGVDEKRSDDDPYKVIYAASLYLYCFIRGGGVPPASGYLSALRNMATISVNLDLESRLQVCRFLAFLVPMLDSGSVVEDAPLSSLLLTLSLVVGSIISDLSVFAEHTMKSERIDQEWSESQDWIESEEVEEAWKAVYHRISAIRQLLLEMYGASGKVRQGADRFLLAVEAGKNNDIRIASLERRENKAGG